jgi:hypothetical protein
MPEPTPATPSTTTTTRPPRRRLPNHLRQLIEADEDEDNEDRNGIGFNPDAGLLDPDFDQ